MNCPKCNAPMETITYQKIEIERCTQCKGIWFDMLEQQELSRIQGVEVVDVGDPQLGKEYDKIRDIICPKCEQAMISMVDMNQEDVWYESCPSCYGIFFDAGEFREYRESNVLNFLQDIFEKENNA